MAILPPDYNPNEVAMYLRKKNPKANIELEVLNGIYLLHCSCPPEKLILPRGWRIIGKYLTNYSRVRKQNVYDLYFV